MPDFWTFIRRWWFPATFFWLAGLYLFWRAVLFPGFFNEALENPGELYLRLWAIPKTLLMYSGLILWPAGLHYYRSIDILVQDLPLQFGFLAAVFFVLSVCLSMPERLRRWAWFGLAWFLVTLLPVANIVPLINEYSLILAAEHFLYLPLIGFLIFLAAVGGWMSTTLQGQVTPRFRRILFVFIVGILAMVTIIQNEFWRGEVPLFERTLKYEPGLGRVHLLLGKAYIMQDRVQEALAEYSAGLQIMQGYVRKTQQLKVVDIYLQYVKAAHFDRGGCYLALGQLARANEEYLASLAVRLRYLRSPEISGQDSLAASNLGFNFIRLGNNAEAKKYFELALQFDGRNSHALNNLGRWYMENGEKDKARYWFETALKVNPGFSVAWENLKKLDKFVK
jgi:tetratricopeptide (TPR) repeat protein